VSTPAEAAAPTAGDLVVQALRTSVLSLAENEPGIAAADDPERVHKARVATRRLRSNLKTFAPLLDKHWANELRKELRWLGAALGEVRDGEVLTARLGAHVDSLPARYRSAGRALVAKLKEETGLMRVRLVATIESERHAELLRRLADGAGEPPLKRSAARPGIDVLPAQVVPRWEHLERRVGALPPDPADAELHRVRILAKRARYAAEAAVPAAGEEAKAFAKALANLQTVLGELQDSITAAAWLRSAASADDPVAGRLIKLEEAAAAAARAEWPKAWKAASRKSLRRWLPEA
jgi:CHAD domain-containing protein